MARPEQIGLAYLQAHPREAARVLEDLPAADVAALLDELPSRQGAPVVEEMQPVSAARCLELLDVELQSSLMAGIAFQSAAGILRQMDEDRRSNLLGQFPTARALVIRALLAYPQDRVGAWINPQVFSAASNVLAGVAIERVRVGGEICNGRFYVTGASQRLLGQVELTTLLRADPGTPLEQILVPCKFQLPAQAALHSILDHPGWEVYATLPVVERGHRYAGVLEYRVLSGALQHGLSLSSADVQGDAMSQIAAGYWNATAGILESLVALLPAGSSAEAAGDGR